MFNNSLTIVHGTDRSSGGFGLPNNLFDADRAKQVSRKAPGHHYQGDRQAPLLHRPAAKCGNVAVIESIIVNLAKIGIIFARLIPLLGSPPASSLWGFNHLLPRHPRWVFKHLKVSFHNLIALD